jgi:hypothetical protein
VTSALEGGEWSAPRPGRFTPGKDPVPIVQEAGGPQGRSEHVRKIATPPWFDPRTVQPVASCYTDWATRPSDNLNGTLKMNKEVLYWAGISSINVSRFASSLLAVVTARYISQFDPAEESARLTV